MNGLPARRSVWTCRVVPAPRNTIRLGCLIACSVSHSLRKSSPAPRSSLSAVRLSTLIATGWLPHSPSKCAPRRTCPRRAGVCTDPLRQQVELPACCRTLPSASCTRHHRRRSLRRAGHRRRTLPSASHPQRREQRGGRGHAPSKKERVPRAKETGPGRARLGGRAWESRRRCAVAPTGGALVGQTEEGEAPHHADWQRRRR